MAERVAAGRRDDVRPDVAPAWAGSVVPARTDGDLASVRVAVLGGPRVVRESIGAVASSHGARVGHVAGPTSCTEWADVLAPLDALDPHVAIVVQEGFVPQSVREVARLTALRPDIRWVVLTDSEPGGYWGALLRAGADLVLPLAVPLTPLVSALRESPGTGPLPPPAERTRMITCDAAGRRAAERLARLSPGELALLQHLVDGRPLADLADGSGVGRRGTARLLVRTLRKLHVGRRRDAVRLWQQASRGAPPLVAG